jgi:UDP-N-acetylmuramoyl-tripeptide--D-alanyl-D-alanine ligase
LSQASGPGHAASASASERLTILNDAYNANPASMRAALETVCELPSAGRRVAVVGDMRELGEHAERYHREAGEFVGRCKLDVLVCVGEHASLIAAAREGRGMGAVYEFKDVASAASFVPLALRKGDLVSSKRRAG